MKSISPNMTKAKAWANDALSKLARMSRDERHLWNATAPSGEQHFNHRRVSYVCTLFPEYRVQFQNLGVHVR
jgi:hypothetical protein